DSVSIVDVSTATPHVIRTLLVGDEPRDIVFAGTGGNRAVITCAHRGQNVPNPSRHDTHPTTEGIRAAHPAVVATPNLPSSLAGTPLSGTPLVLYTDTPRAVAVSTDGSTVYAAGFHTGNRTTTINEGAVCDTDSTHLNNGTVQPSCSTGPGGLPLPHRFSTNG